MKTIKIFLASSEELIDDRNAFGNLVRRLDKIYEKRGIRIELFEWEDYDAAYNDRRKQNEYNDHIKAADMFLALFHTKAGKFTIEEFNVATEEFKRHASPKVYTYCKDLQAGEQESPELAEFKRKLFEEMGHYWSRYNNRDSMQLHFVMQLQLVETSGMVEKLKLEEGTIVLEGMPIAKMENLKFAAANEDYLRMQTDIQELRKEIEEMQLELEKKQRRLETKKAKLEENPDDEDCQEDYNDIKKDVDKLIDRLQPKLNKYNKLKEDFAKHQELLFNTAKRVAKLQGEEINDRIRRAMDALNDGLVREANTILNEAEIDAKNLLNEYKQSKEITEQKRQNLVISIKELSLKASSIMADASILIDERIKQADEIYELANSIAEEINYDQENYIDFLWDYSAFLHKYARYDKAIEIRNKLIKMFENFYGKEHLDTAGSYGNIGNVYKELSNYDKAMEYHKKALKIKEKVLGREHPDTAITYNNIGIVYHDLDDNDKALEYHMQALKIKEKVLGKEHLDTATSYNNIGTIYSDLGNYDKALNYYKQALDIQEKVLGKEHLDTATSYNNIGIVYSDLGNYDKALEYHKQALEIREKVLGKEHPDTADSYNNIGTIFYDLGDYNKALKYFKQALEIREKVLSKEHPDTANSYHNIGNVYFNLGDYDKALDYYILATEQRCKHAYNNLAWSLHLKGKYNEALPWAEKAVETDPDNPEIIDTLATVYQGLGRYSEAMNQFELCLKLKKEQDATEESIHETEEKIAALRKLMN